jgi:hypothetical protein
MWKVLLGGVVGGVIVFFWGAVAHMMLPLGQMGMSTISQSREERVLAELKGAIFEPGLYFFPGHDMSKPLSKAETAAWEARMKKGPTGILVIKPNGGEVMSPKTLGIEFVSGMLAAVVGSIILYQVTSGYAARVLVLPLVGLFGWLSILVSYWNWYGYPTEYVIAELITEVVGWLLAGFVLATFVKPAAPKVQPVAATS